VYYDPAEYVLPDSSAVVTTPRVHGRRHPPADVTCAVQTGHMDRDWTLKQWLRMQAGGEECGSRSSCLQVALAFALCDPDTPTFCEGFVVVSIDGTWECSHDCDGPPVTRHSPDYLALCGESGRPSGCHCWHCEERQTW
jgi:hypothetical protein